MFCLIWEYLVTFMHVPVFSDMTFLGIELDTITLDNVLKIKDNLSEMRVRRKITLRELQTFAC
jgi:hypothetical protein